MNTLTPAEARRLFLHSQGLYGRGFGRGKSGALHVIEHIRYVQIDTIAVVERAHHHTIWARARDYHKRYLGELLADKAIFEYWSHAAAYLPMRDYRYSLPRKKDYADGKQHWFRGTKPVQYVYDRIQAEGPLQSKDFEDAKEGSGWWAWKTTKQALEQLFMAGQLMVAERRGFQKVYDLTERVLPAGIDTTVPTEAELARHLIRSAIGASGFASAAEISYLRPGQKAPVQRALQQLMLDGELQELRVGGSGERFYTTDERLRALEELRPQKKLHILSPFDNAVIQRRRLALLFDYAYGIECYVPAAKRVHGYFCLPVLYGDRFVGRMDCKADATTGTFSIKALWMEATCKITDAFLRAFANGVRAYAAFCRTEHVRLERSNLEDRSQQALKELLK